MRLALLSDLHANLQAFDACVADARQQGATTFAFLGDLVGYGAQPGAVLDRVMELAQQGALVLRGNHDEMAIRPPPEGKRADEAGAAWTHDQLSPAQRDYLDSLPLTIRHEFVLLVHASAHEPQRWTYVDNGRDAAVSLQAASEQGDLTHVFGGHVHEQTLFYQGRGRYPMAFTPTAGVPIPVPRHRHWLATVGSVGQPRDGHAEAMYALFDTDALKLRFLRVPYDHWATALVIRAAGLPEFNARRLALGQ